MWRKEATSLRFKSMREGDRRRIEDIEYGMKDIQRMEDRGWRMDGADSETEELSVETDEVQVASPRGCTPLCPAA